MGYSRHRLNEVVALQKAVLDRIEADLGEFGNSPRRKYIREFHDEFQTYDAVCSRDEIADAAAQANLVWVGDYHALARSRSSAAELLRQIAARKNSNIALGVEVVFARHQKILDRWMRGAIGEDEFLSQIRYFEQWGCDWPSYRVLFDAARELAIPVYGLDCGPRTDLRSIGRRDQGVARRIGQLLEKDPSRTMVVVFGESHLASAHLPRRVRGLKRTTVSFQDLVVLQNVDKVYWKLQRAGMEGVQAARIRAGQYCLFNATPLEKY